MNRMTLQITACGTKSGPKGHKERKQRKLYAQRKEVLVGFQEPVILNTR